MEKNVQQRVPSRESGIPTSYHTNRDSCPSASTHSNDRFRNEATANVSGESNAGAEEVMNSNLTQACCLRARTRSYTFDNTKSPSPSTSPKCPHCQPQTCHYQPEASIQTRHYQIASSCHKLTYHNYTLSTFFLLPLLLLLLSSFICSASGFNVDTLFPVSHSGVGVEQNSLFGFSISQFKSEGENYILVGAPRHHHHHHRSHHQPSSSSSSPTRPPSVTSGRGALFRCRANPFTDSFGAQQLCQDLKIEENVSDYATTTQEVCD